MTSVTLELSDQPFPVVDRPENLEGFELLWRLCQRLAKPDNPMVPSALWGKPEALLGVILMGRELGISDMTALQRIQVVRGQVVLSADLIRGLIRRRGHRLEYLERSTTRCEIVGTRADSGETMSMVWDIEEARRAGLAERGNWQKFPRQMLDARATTELARALFSDCIGWAVYSAEDFGEVKE